MPSNAGRSRIADLCSNAVPFLVEFKWIRRSGTGNQKIREIHEDTQTNAKHIAPPTTALACTAGHFGEVALGTFPCRKAVRPRGPRRRPSRGTGPSCATLRVHGPRRIPALRTARERRTCRPPDPATRFRAGIQANAAGGLMRPLTSEWRGIRSVFG